MWSCGYSYKHLFSIPVFSLWFAVSVKATAIAPGPSHIRMEPLFMLPGSSSCLPWSPRSSHFTLHSDIHLQPSLPLQPNSWTSLLVLWRVQLELVPRRGRVPGASSLHVRFSLPGIPLLTLPPSWHHSHSDSKHFHQDASLAHILFLLPEVNVLSYVLCILCHWPATLHCYFNSHIFTTRIGASLGKKLMLT